MMFNFAVLCNPVTIYQLVKNQPSYPEDDGTKPVYNSQEFVQRSGSLLVRFPMEAMGLPSLENHN